MRHTGSARKRRAPRCGLPVQAFLALNRLQAEQLVEVIIMSRNSPNTSLRIFRSVQEYGLDISRAALSGGGEIAPYLKSYETDLFLSANAADVQQAIDRRGRGRDSAREPAG